MRSWIFGGRPGTLRWSFILILLAAGGWQVKVSAETLDQRSLEASVERQNKQLPKMIDAETRMDKVTTGKHEVIYHYTMVHVQAANINQQKAEAFSRVMEREVTTKICQNPTALRLLKSGVSIIYHYESADHKELAHITIPLTLCLGHSDVSSANSH